MTVHVFGVRHHGPGSARSLLRALAALAPDAVLVEGPPDADGVLPLAAHAGMVPPVALLVYVPDQPRRAVYYPFAAFSPEWQAVRYGLGHGVLTRFIDLPQAHRLALPEEELAHAPHADPIGSLARAAGHADPERWWERLVEQRQDDTEVFAAILEAMAAVREQETADADATPAALFEARREAHMRQCMRAAEREGRRRIAVVCGAWHAPALVGPHDPRADAALLKGLPAIKVQATWTPWTHGRLTYTSGYGAGIASPGWYAHLWDTPRDVAVRWLTRVARLLRDEGLDISPAHTIEAARLSESIAALRDEPQPGLEALMEACRAVFCLGDDLPLRLVQAKLIVGEALGEVPESTPMAPLQQDLQREQKRLRFQPAAEQRAIDLDLRSANDRDRSHLLHRLLLLDVPWGTPQQAAGKSGTFHELWTVQWHPEFAVVVIEAGVWGNTVADAAAARTAHAAGEEQTLATLLALLDRALCGDLSRAVEAIVGRIEAVAALTGDVEELLDALPPLANILRYGSVRGTDTAVVQAVLDGVIPRLCIGLPGACASLNDDSAKQMVARLAAADRAIAVLRRTEHVTEWRATLSRLADQQGVHGLAAGRCLRLLLDARALETAVAARRLELALSQGNEPAQAAAWIEGFLAGSGLLLLHDEALWQVLDAWVCALPSEAFIRVLPLLRRTFATFTAPERRRLGERVRGGAGSGLPESVNTRRAMAVVPILARLLGPRQAEGAE